MKTCAYLGLRVKFFVKVISRTIMHLIWVIVEENMYVCVNLNQSIYLSKVQFGFQSRTAIVNRYVR